MPSKKLLIYAPPPSPNSSSFHAPASCPQPTTLYTNLQSTAQQTQSRTCCPPCVRASSHGKQNRPFLLPSHPTLLPRARSFGLPLPLPPSLPRRVAFPSTGSLFKAAGVHTEAKLAEMGITLPPPGVPKGNFAMAVRSGNHIYLCTLYDGGSRWFFPLLVFRLAFFFSFSSPYSATSQPHPTPHTHNPSQHTRTHTAGHLPHRRRRQAHCSFHPILFSFYSTPTPHIHNPSLSTHTLHSRPPPY